MVAEHFESYLTKPYKTSPQAEYTWNGIPLALNQLGMAYSCHCRMKPIYFGSITKSDSNRRIRSRKQPRYIEMVPISNTKKMVYLDLYIIRVYRIPSQYGLSERFHTVFEKVEENC